jgi:hypothetical protein
MVGTTGCVYKKTQKQSLPKTGLQRESKRRSVKEEQASGNDENSTRVRTETNDSGEDKNQVQVSETTPSGEFPGISHASGENRSPETLHQAQVNSPALKTLLLKKSWQYVPTPSGPPPPLETETEQKKNTKEETETEDHLRAQVRAGIVLR